MSSRSRATTRRLGATRRCRPSHELDAVTATPARDPADRWPRRAAQHARRSTLAGRPRHARRRARPTGRRPGSYAATANRLVGRVGGDARIRPRIEELQLSGAARAARRRRHHGARDGAAAGVRAAATSRSSSRIARDCRCPSRSSSAPWTYPRRSNSASRRSGATSRPTVDRRARPPRIGDPYADGRARGELAFDDEILRGLLPRRARRRPAGGHARDRGPCDRAGARPRGSGSTARWIPGERRHFRARRHRIEHFEMPTSRRSSAPRCSGSRRRSSRRSTPPGGTGRAVRAARSARTARGR